MERHTRQAHLSQGGCRVAQSFLLQAAWSVITCSSVKVAGTGSLNTFACLVAFLSRLFAQNNLFC